MANGYFIPEQTCPWKTRLDLRKIFIPRKTHLQINSLPKELTPKFISVKNLS